MVINKLRNVLLFWLALLALLALSSSLSKSDRDYFSVESSLVDGILPVFSIFHSIKTGVVSWWTHYMALTHTQQENKHLKDQLIQLKQENIRLREMASANERLKKLLQLKAEISGPSMVAKVVGSGPSPFLQTFYIDKGRKEGLVRGMPVLRPEGVVGRLEKTSGHFSQVILLNDPSFAVDCLSQRTRVRGVLTGIPGEKNCQVKYIVRTEDIRAGDIIVTSGLDQLFPKGLILGRVLRVVSQVKGNFLFVEVVPECQLSHIEEVLIFQKRPPLPDLEESRDG
ncbi:MAG: rod shape-determining protein MreC [Thermodesulfobacteriota bacterium]|jgi:rod shape-determining protein MreC